MPHNGRNACPLDVKTILTTAFSNSHPSAQTIPHQNSMETSQVQDTNSSDATIEELLAMIDFDALEELCFSNEIMLQSTLEIEETATSGGKRMHHELIQELRYEIETLRRQRENLHTSQHLRESLDRLLSTAGEPSSRLYAFEEKRELALAKVENTQLKERVRANIKIIKQAKSILDKQHAGARAASA